MPRFVSIACLLAAISPTATFAQTAYSGETSCTKVIVEHRILPESQPGHAFVLRQGLCTFTKPAKVNGVAQVVETYTGTEEIDGTTAQWRGLNTTKMANGDRIFVRIECTNTVAKDGTETNGACKFTLIGGTGKMMGVTGSGTSKQTSATDPAAPWAFSGTYKAAP